MGFLERIVDRVREDLRSPTYATGLPEIRSPQRRPSLREAIVRAPNGWALVVERKRRSPGRAPPDLPERPIEEFVRTVSAARVDGLSCLATRPSFEGSPAEVRELAERSRLPVLFKDFVVDPGQVEAAARAGASAILLIARLESEGLLDRSVAELADRAHRVGLEVVLELHRSEELKVADRVPADVYGVNVRDLDSLELRPDVAEETFRSLGGRRPALGLSGVSGPEEARRFRSWGAEGILVGRGFATSREPRAFLVSLRAVGRERRS